MKTEHIYFDYTKMYYITPKEREFASKIINGKGLLQYFKYKNKRKGIFIAFKENEKIYIGYSFCHKNEQNFNRNIGIIEAYRRAKKENNLICCWKPWTKNQKLCLNEFFTQFNSFYLRTLKYFKTYTTLTEYMFWECS